MQSIIPSPDLTNVFGSKLRLFMQCQRKYFLAYICNLERIGFYLPFVMGKIFHEGVEDWYNGMSSKTVMKNTVNRINTFLFENIIDDERRKKVRSEVTAVQGMLQAYMRLYKGERESYEVVHAEQTFSIRLKDPGIDFIGTVDLLLMREENLYLCDHKTARFFDQGTIQGIPMDSQLQSYPLLVERCMGQRVKGLIYNVIRKPSIRHKQGETFDEFIQRISDEYSEKTTEYFWREEIPFQPKHAERVWRDLQLVIWDLYGKHQMFREIGRDNPDSAVLDENNWPRDTRRCHDYNSRCEFWYMCRYGRNKYTEPFLFKQRKGLERGDIIYEEGPKENQAGAKTD